MLLSGVLRRRQFRQATGSRQVATVGRGEDRRREGEGVEAGVRHSGQSWQAAAVVVVGVVRRPRLLASVVVVAAVRHNLQQRVAMQAQRVPRRHWQVGRTFVVPP